MTVLAGETYRRVFSNLPDLENPPFLSYGRPHYEACAHHVETTFDGKRAYIIASTSLSKHTDEVDKLKNALGDRMVGLRIGIAPHTPWDEVVEATKHALEKRADCLITIGGGSLIDAAKAMLLFMANNIVTVPDVLIRREVTIYAEEHAAAVRYHRLYCPKYTANMHPYDTCWRRIYAICRRYGS